MSLVADSLDDQFSDEAEKRIEARRKLILDALLAAGGEPADGRWSHVAQLSRLGVTRGGRRWLGTNVERGIPQQRSKVRKEVPDTQEKKRIQDNFLRHKVESWKQALRRDCVSGVSGTPGAATEGLCDLQKPNASRRTRDTRGVLNFKVTKRYATSNAPAKSPNPPQNNLYSSGQPSSNGHAAFEPELSFLPPSFPSHLATSTPQHPARRKPAPIPRVTVSSPCISSENLQIYDDTMPPPYESQALPAPSSHTANSKTPVPLPTLTELLVTSKKKARQRRMSQSTNSSPPRPIFRSGDRVNPANDDPSHESVDLDARLRKGRTIGLGFVDHDPGGIEFDPLFTSTQRSGPINGHSSPTNRDLWRGYNSQFDVDRRTADVAELLDKDVFVEY